MLKWSSECRSGKAECGRVPRCCSAPRRRRVGRGSGPLLAAHTSTHFCSLEHSATALNNVAIFNILLNICSREALTNATKFCSQIMFNVTKDGNNKM